LELEKDITELAKELGHTKSKVIKDILRNFFLDQKLKQREFELSDIN
jgi:predicted DNA-binding protein